MSPRPDGGFRYHAQDCWSDWTHLHPLSQYIHVYIISRAYHGAKIPCRKISWSRVSCYYCLCPGSKGHRCESRHSPRLLRYSDSYVISSPGPSWKDAVLKSLGSRIVLYKNIAISKSCHDSLCSGFNDYSNILTYMSSNNSSMKQRFIWCFFRIVIADECVTTTSGMGSRHAHGALFKLICVVSNFSGWK